LKEKKQITFTCKR